MLIFRTTARDYSQSSTPTTSKSITSSTTRRSENSSVVTSNYFKAVITLSKLLLSQSNSQQHIKSISASQQTQSTLKSSLSKLTLILQLRRTHSLRNDFHPSTEIKAQGGAEGEEEIMPSSRAHSLARVYLSFCLSNKMKVPKQVITKACKLFVTFQAVSQPPAIKLWRD